MLDVVELLVRAGKGHGKDPQGSCGRLPRATCHVMHSPPGPEHAARFAILRKYALLSAPAEGAFTYRPVSPQIPLAI